ncbi:hypothetical protein F383_37598 [Gossypium arboreum]|uniref:Uncharacterized protein n=1 Tax=Gossypium arboreum TaxID=29729 RepID=A0A0B0MG12_GOSAR|nr:hypothetical protein F383_37598 [Gossypium arboreum]
MLRCHLQNLIENFSKLEKLEREL